MHWTEAEELAARVLGLDVEDTPGREIEYGMDDKFGIDMETFQKIAEALIPFTIPAPTAINNTLCRGFVYDGSFICREEVPADGGEIL